jgi:hypothetical protein
MTQRMTHIWSLASFGITVAHYLILYGIAAHLLRQEVEPGLSLYSVKIGWLHLFLVLLSTATAITSIAVERPRFIGYLALFLGGLSFLFYVG